MTAQSDALAALTTQVNNTVGAESSAIVLIQGLAAEIAAAVATNDTAALTSLSASLSTSTNALAAAVAANPVANTAPVVNATPTPVANVAVANTVASN
jgi:hypothetical protein